MQECRGLVKLGRVSKGLKLSVGHLCCDHRLVALAAENRVTAGQPEGNTSRGGGGGGDDQSASARCREHL